MMNMPKNLTRYSVLLAVAGSYLVSTASAQTLLLRYDFDVNSNDDPALDSGVAPSADGTFEGGATRTTSSPGDFSPAGLNVTGSGQYVSGGDAEKLDGLSQFSLTGWLNLQADPSHGARIITKQDGNANFDGFSFALNNPTEGAEQLSASNFSLNLAHGGVDGFSFNTSGADLDADNQWIFVAVTFDGLGTTNNVNFYHGDVANGVSLLGTGSAESGITASNDVAFMVGSTGAAAGAASPPAFFDDTRVYDGILSEAELETVRLSNVPEPSTYALFAGVGALGLILLRRRRTGRS